MAEVTYVEFSQATKRMPHASEKRRMPSAMGNDSSGLDVREEILVRVPSLRALARSMCRNFDNAEDLLQDTILKAWLNIHQFQPGTNICGWLFTIMRNHFYGQHRKLRHEVEDIDGQYSVRQAVAPEQDNQLTKNSLSSALSKLRPLEREALLLVAIHGLTYEQTANALDCPIGTIKSRIARARIKLAKLMSFNPNLDLEADGLMKATLQSAQIGREDRI